MELVPSIDLRGGRAVLDAIERQGFDVWLRRPVVSRWRKVGLLLRACVKAFS